MIELRTVAKSYRLPGLRRRRAAHGGGRQVVLDGIDLELPSGSVIAIAGRNGAGKTTLLRVLAGLSPPDSGRILVDGVDLAPRPERLRRIVGFAASSDRGFFGRLAVRENLRFFAALGGVGGESLSARVDRGLEEVGLLGHRDRPYRCLSNGERQRLALARALIGRPRILLLDEPTRSLDDEGADRALELLRELHDRDPDRTIVFSTHDRVRADRLADRVVTLESGRIAAETPILKAPRYALRTSPMLRPGDLGGLAAIAGVSSVERGASESSATVVSLGTLAGLDSLVDGLRARGLRILELSPLPRAAACRGRAGEGP